MEINQNEKPIPEFFCAICLEKDIPSNFIIFSCKHFFCIKCSPCLLLSCLRSPKQILEDFFQKAESNCFCPICSTGTALIPSEKFLQGLDESGKRICDGCDENKPVNFCVDCNKIFCNKCMAEVHLPKKYQNHRLSDIQNLVQKPQFQCVCPGKHYLSHICLSCKTSICPFCLKFGHEKHDILPLMGLAKNYYPEQLQDKIQFLSKTCTNLLNSISSARQQFSQLIDGIVAELLDLKISNEIKLLSVEKASESQNELAQNILAIVNKELAQKDLHPNKQFHILKALNDIKFPPDQEQNINEEKNFKELLKIKEMVLKMNEKPEENLNDFKTNPIELFQDAKNEFILEEKTFSGNCSCSFIINGQSFISWAGYSTDKDINSLINIYNFTQMKREKSIPNEGDEIVLNFLSFPKTQNSGYKGNKLLYSGDRKGIVRIYAISSEETPVFKLISKLQTNAGEIFSIMIFFDKFMELGVHSKTLKKEEYLCFCYIMITTYNKSILLYKNTRNYSNQDNWILYRQIDNPVNASCYSMEYFYDEQIHKTRFFFGFTGNYIGGYDLRKNIWGKTELSTKRIVTSIISILKPGNSQINEWFLVYTQSNSNSVIVGNASLGNIERKACLENANDVYDCCLWNDGSSETKGDEAENCYLIVSCYGWPPSIVILDFYTLNVLFLKKMDPYPVNSIKFLRRIGDKKLRKAKLCIMKTKSLI